MGVVFWISAIQNGYFLPQIPAASSGGCSIFSARIIPFFRTHLDHFCAHVVYKRVVGSLSGSLQYKWLFFFRQIPANHISCTKSGPAVRAQKVVQLFCQHRCKCACTKVVHPCACKRRAILCSPFPMRRRLSLRFG